MGQIHEAPLNELALDLARASGARDFVETGTFQGDAVNWAAIHFDRVWTLEISAEYQAHARARNSRHANVRYYLGDSASLLPEIVRQLRGPAIFWLDAHAGAGYFASVDSCPLLAELDTIVSSHVEHCVLVDDARAFVAPPPPPFDYRQWPSLEEIFALVLKRPQYHVTIISDAILIVPKRLRALVATHCFRIRPTI